MRELRYQKAVTKWSVRYGLLDHRLPTQNVHLSDKIGFIIHDKQGDATKSRYMQ
jgi:hypothetical protein